MIDGPNWLTNWGGMKDEYDRMMRIAPAIWKYEEVGVFYKRGNKRVTVTMLALC